jgi:hypothetical protein
MTLLRYRRLADAPPPERELLDIDEDGSFTMWRSNGPTIGRFEGQVTHIAELAGRAMAAASAAVPEAADIPADASMETVELEGGSLSVEAGEPVAGPWGEVLTACRSLLDALRDRPVAAVTLEIVDAGHARLVHAGREVLPLELDYARIGVTAWADGQQAGSGGTEGLGLGRVDAAPGWSTELTLPPVDAPTGAKVVVTVDAVADDAGLMIPVRWTAPPFEA